MKGNDKLYLANVIEDYSLHHDRGDYYLGSQQNIEWYLESQHWFFAEALQLIEPVQALTTRELFYMD